MLYLLYDGGGYLAHTVGHGHPARGAHLGHHGDIDIGGVHTNLHLVLALATDHVTILAAGDWRCSGDGEADGALHTLLQLLQEALSLSPLLAELHLPLSQPGL